MSNRSRLQNQGFSLVEVLMGSAILGFLAMVFFGFMNYQTKMNSVTGIADDLITIRHDLMLAVDCFETMDPFPSQCLTQPVSFLPVRDRKGNIIIKDAGSSPPTRVAGKYGLRARCLPCSDCINERMIVVEYAAASDPRESDWKDIFNGVPLRCQVQGNL